ncbi:MAG: 8-amino-7-oxononanoate synthase [Acidobacteria bacterium]|nr:MAG: 8-amino-7-oxononanoate synthase [Acidobacteriota bacterium]
MNKPDTDSTIDSLRMELDSLDAQHRLRRLGQIEGANLSSNDYLGLSTDPRLARAVAAALESGSPVASTGSRLLSGNAAVWEELESVFARFIGTEAALFFSSGYAANVGLLSAILRPDDTVFSDESNHASLIDGMRLSRARKVIFPHLDLDFLEDALGRSDSAGRKFIVVESLFSMEGDRAPVPELLSLADRFGADLVVDEAHATGVFGPRGRGLVAAAGANARVLASVHPCGKALASAGAFVCGSETLKQFLVNRARTFIYSTALPPYFAAQISKAVGIAAEAAAGRERLLKLAGYLRERLQQAGFNIGQSDSQIVPVMLGSNDAVTHYARELNQHGFAVRPIRPPTVPEGTSRLRLSVTTNLSQEILERLAQAMVAARDSLHS